MVLKAPFAINHHFSLAILILFVAFLFPFKNCIVHLDSILNFFWRFVIYFLYFIDHFPSFWSIKYCNTALMRSLLVVLIWSRDLTNSITWCLKFRKNGRFGLRTPRGIHMFKLLMCRIVLDAKEAKSDWRCQVFPQ